MDNNFNMQGGFFSPTGYFKVETGGTHDENPNGGVQIGVDQQGIPNMLEEGEPVYDDYVYSDNIRADKAILKQFNLPEKYAGKLYSEIADAYVDEAEVRPLDTVSNNGLKVMLGRLADAQEYQKQLQEEKELEEELANLSPEELAELEAMLANQAQGQMPVEQEQVVAPEMMQQPVMMANGGNLIRRFDKGNPGEIVVPQLPDLPLDIQNDDFSDIVYDTDMSGIDSSVPRVALMSHRIPGLKFVSDDGNAIAYEYPEELQPAISIASMSPRRSANSGSSSTLNDNGTVQNPAPDLSKYDKPDFITDEYSWLDGIDLDRLLKEAELLKINEDELKVEPIKTATTGSKSTPTYATWPRYAGLAHNLFTAGVNMFQQPDHYEFPYLRAHEPEMQMPVLIDPRYRPTDRNIIVNDILASSAGTARQILNSGNPISAPASLVALDYNTGRNIGTGLLQVDDANNTQLNNVIAGKNNNRMQLGQLAFELARARSAALSNADRINLQSNMSQQLYNNQAEQQWADAVGTPLDYFAKGMSDLGYENMNRNMINSNKALKYGSYGTGVGFYKGSRGGMLKTYKK